MRIFFTSQDNTIKLIKVKINVFINKSWLMVCFSQPIMSYLCDVATSPLVIWEKVDYSLCVNFQCALQDTDKLQGWSDAILKLKDNDTLTPVALNLTTSTAAVHMDDSAVYNNSDHHLNSILPPTLFYWHLQWCTATAEAQASWISYESGTFSNECLWYVVVQFKKFWSGYGMFQSLSSVGDSQMLISVLPGKQCNA